MDDQPFDEHWYLSENQSLLASPNFVELPKEEGSVVVRRVGSQLVVDQVMEALFRVYDPFSGSLVVDRADGISKRIVEVQSKRCAGDKLVLSANWSAVDPLPHPTGPVPLCGLFPTIVCAMGARTLNISPDLSIKDAPDIEDCDILPFGNGLAVVTDGGAFLLDAGRRNRSNIVLAERIVEAMAAAEDAMSQMQSDISQHAEAQANEMSRFAGLRSWLQSQRFCTDLTARIVEVRATLDRLLGVGDSDLRQLRDALSERWGIGHRIRELTDEISSLQQNGKSAEELRAFAAGRLAAGIAIALVAADALAGRLTPALTTCNLKLCTVLADLSPAWLELAEFVGIFVFTLALTYLVSRLYRFRVWVR
jgi:hypothetical protein